MTAVTSRVDPAEFSEEALAARVRDLHWITKKALAHELVLERLLVNGWTLLPFRFGTLYRDRSHVEAFLQDWEQQLNDALARVEGHTELGVRAKLDGARAEALRRERAQAAAQPGGRGAGADYLSRRKTEIESDAGVERDAVEFAQTAHERLAELAAESQIGQSRATADGGSVDVLNAAYLVERAREGEFREAAAQLEGEAWQAAVRLQVTGPWPPYNFAPDLASR